MGVDHSKESTLPHNPTECEQLDLEDMNDVSSFWRNPKFQDATLLLSSNRSLLEQHRATLQATVSLSIHECDTCKRFHEQTKRSPIADHDHDSASIAGPSSQLTTRGTIISKRLPVVAGAAAGQGQVVTIPVHRLILSTGSDYFKTAISTLIGDQAASGECLAHPLHPIIVVFEEDIDAAQEVLHYLYTKTVDSVCCKAPRLMQMILIADRWMMPLCISACCKALAALPSATMNFNDLLAIYAPGGGPIPPGLAHTPGFKLATNAALSKLLSVFGDAPTVIASPILTAKLLLLPQAALVALLSSDKLTTDSEDSVLMLLSWWLEGTEGVPCVCNEQSLSELMKVIRYSRLSLTYLVQALPLVLHLRLTQTQLADIYEFRSVPAQSMLLLKDLKSKCPIDWFKACRPLSTSQIHHTISFSLDISDDDLYQHVDEVRTLKEGGTPPSRFSTDVNFRGYVITLLFASKGTKQGVAIAAENFGVYLQVRARLPSCNSFAELPRGVISSFKLHLHNKIPGQARELFAGEMPISFCKQKGWLNFYQLASKLPGDPMNISWWDPFIIDGRLRIVAQFKDERTICD